MKPIEFDPLKGENWSKVYDPVPDSVHAGVQLAFARIRARERRRKNVLRAVAAAACLALLLGAGGIAFSRKTDAPDRVSAPVAHMKMLAMNSIVFAARADASFHVYSGCSEAMAEQVELQLITALEFEKELCPVCGANVLLPE